jgi:hypothetical protein
MGSNKRALTVIYVPLTVLYVASVEVSVTHTFIPEGETISQVSLTCLFPADTKAPISERTAGNVPAAFS